MTTAKYQRHNGKKIIGLIESITLEGKDGRKKEVLAKIDTGATKGSIDINLASELNIGPIIGTKLVKSAHGNSLRPMASIKIKIAGAEVKAKFTLADRNHMKYAVLIGQNALRKGEFLIDPKKK